MQIISLPPLPLGMSIRKPWRASSGRKPRPTTLRVAGEEEGARAMLLHNPGGVERLVGGSKPVQQRLPGGENEGFVSRFEVLTLMTRIDGATHQEVATHLYRLLWAENEDWPPQWRECSKQYGLTGLEPARLMFKAAHPLPFSRGGGFIGDVDIVKKRSPL